MDINLLNGLSLAYMGDAIFELYVRYNFINMGITKNNNLHKMTTKYTSSKGQAKIIRYFIKNNILNDDEILIYKKGRNSHVNLSRKNLDLHEYLDSTGLEALFGYLYLNNDIKRIEELMEIIMKGADIFEEEC